MVVTPKVEFRFPPELLARVDALVAKGGRSAFVIEAVSEKLDREERQGVERPDPTRIVHDAHGTSGKCRHPVTRRIGNQCAACGATIKGTG